MSAKRRSKQSKRYGVAIIGTGLIGTSIGLAVRRRKPQTSILGWDPNRDHARLARRMGAIDGIAESFAAAVGCADLIVLAAPLDAIVRFVPDAIRLAHARAFIIDVGPLLAPVVTAARAPLRRGKGVAGFAAGHPMAGRESSGPAQARPDLFDGRPFALFVPPQRDRARIWHKAEAFARLLGSNPVRLDPSRHDKIVASTSALPQLASLAIALAAERAAGHTTAPWISGPGFDGATRLAESSFSVWEAALRANARNTRRTLRALAAAANALEAALESGNLGKIEGFFRAAAAARRRILGKTNRRTNARNS